MVRQVTKSSAFDLAGYLCYHHQPDIFLFYLTVAQVQSSNGGFLAENEQTAPQRSQNYPILLIIR
ncbi:MAG: hypothetical protein V7K30_21895 [Nostoc sp.]